MTSANGALTYGWFRIFYAYGPFQRNASLIPNIFSNLMRGGLPNLKAPFNANDFIHVDDVANALCKGVNCNLLNSIYNIGYGKSERVFDVCRLAENIVFGATHHSDQLLMNSEVVVGNNFWADNLLTMERLGWRPSIGLAEGLMRQWAHMKPQ